MKLERSPNNRRYISIFSNPSSYNFFKDSRLSFGTSSTEIEPSFLRLSSVDTISEIFDGMVDGVGPKSEAYFEIAAAHSHSLIAFVIYQLLHFPKCS